MSKTTTTESVPSSSSQGLARTGGQQGQQQQPRQVIKEFGSGRSADTSNNDRIAGLTMAMKLKSKNTTTTTTTKGGKSGGSSMMALGNREVSARRQVGDAESVVNSQGVPWWRNVGMEVRLIFLFCMVLMMMIMLEGM